MITTDFKWSPLTWNDEHCWLQMMNTDFEYLSHQDTIQEYQACSDCLPVDIKWSMLT